MQSASEGAGSNETCWDEAALVPGCEVHLASTQVTETCILSDDHCIHVVVVACAAYSSIQVNGCSAKFYVMTRARNGGTGWQLVCTQVSDCAQDQCASLCYAKVLLQHLGIEFTLLSDGIYAYRSVRHVHHVKDCPGVVR